MKQGDAVMFKPKKGRPMLAEVAFTPIKNATKVEIIIGTDPFPVDVPVSQVSACEPNGKVVRSPKVRKDRASTKGPGKMAPATKDKPSAKQLRTQAQGLGIKGWEDMTRKELRRAIRKASSNGTSADKPAKAATPKETTPVTKARPKTKAAAAKAKTSKSKPKAAATKPKASKPKVTKAAAKKAAVVKSTKSTKAAIPGVKDVGNGITLHDGPTPKATPAVGENPFRKNSNLHRVAKLLLKGGVRRSLAEKLKAQVDLHPYQKAKKDVSLSDFDKRLLLGAGTMRDEYGYGIQRTGRGIEGRILVFVPGSPNDPRKKVAKKSGKK